MSVERLFSAADLEAIRAATAEAEARTGGEIVPYIVERVVDGEAARWRGATLGALAAALAAGLVHALGGHWGGSGVWWITLPAIAGAGVAYLAAGVDAIGRRLMPDDLLESYVKLRAEAAFLEEEVFATRDRTGILIFLALAERRAVILGDDGINRAVPEGQWQELVDRLVAGIRAGRPREALCETIARCGEVLERFQVTRRPDDRDELVNQPRLREH
ncbi:MAG: TPM domain-containing protein [Thermoanaerobaculales bacterium]|jgi:putative membrane protein|nr:TPM domain-containing protein [Thermoanaerobaculales bacterium]